MQRLRDERGAVAVVVALLMVPLLGFAAISIDVAGIYSERQQLQTGADAGALAIAQDCGHGACGTPSATAQSFAASNLNHGQSTASVTLLTSTKVTVSNSGVRQDLFAPVLGINTTTITAKATVIWGAPIAGTTVLPLAFSWCEWSAQTGGGMPSGTVQRTIFLTKSSGVSADCTGPSNNVVPGGFGWLKTNPGSCKTTTAIGGIVGSDPGNSVPSGCSTIDLAAQQGQIVLLPMFDAYAGTGSTATYRIYGYAAFMLTGYHFGGQYNWNDPCSGNGRCIRGYFVRFVDLTDALTYGATAPQLGASLVRLSA